MQWDTIHMMREASPPASLNTPLLPALAGLFAIAIFAVDTLSPLGMAVAVLYVVVVLLAVNFLPPRGVLLVAFGCAALAVSSFLLQHGETAGAPLVRLLVSLAAIGVTAFLVLKNQAATAELYEQTRLLDLTHDTIFVRDMNDVITYWNRGAEALYGWRRDQAVGSVAHQLLRTTFPAPFEDITAELLRTDRWEGELGHAKKDGERLVVASRWALQRDDRGRPVAILETNTDITDRKRAEEKLRQAERDLRATIDTIPAMVMRVAPDGTVEFINARWGEEGFSEEGLLKDWTAYVHPDDLQDFVKVRTRSLATGEPYEAEARFRRVDGEYRWCLIRVVSLRDETGKPIKRFSTATDIEDRKRAENALRRSEALLVETQKLSRTGSLFLDVATREVIWSAECARIFGYEPSVKPTMSLALQRVHPDDLHLAQWAIDGAIGGGIDTAYIEYRLVMPNGAVKYVHSAFRSETDASGSRVALGAVTDVTAAKVAEAALHETQAELAHVARMTTLGELTASLAHEVNQPLAAIVTNGEVCLRLLDQEVVDLAEVREAIGDAISNGRRASEIIRRVRALSKKAETQKVALDINDVINEVISLLQREVTSHRVSLRLDLSPALPAVFGDRIQLQQVIINLVVNGMEAMADISDRPRDLTVRSRQGTGQVIVAVQDSGVGIDPDNVKRLFNAFFTTKPSGMGMGLSICRSIIENHGGRLSASRNADVGATFQFALPPHQEGRP